MRRKRRDDSDLTRKGVIRGEIEVSNMAHVPGSGSYLPPCWMLSRNEDACRLNDPSASVFILDISDWLETFLVVDDMV